MLIATFQLFLLLVFSRRLGKSIQYGVALVLLEFNLTSPQLILVLSVDQFSLLLLLLLFISHTTSCIGGHVSLGH